MAGVTLPCFFISLPEAIFLIGQPVPLVKNCKQGLESAALALRTDPEPFLPSVNWLLSWFVYQFGRMPVLEEARTIDYVTNHNVITIDHHGDEHFQNIKNGGRTRGNIGVKYSLLFRFHFDFSMPNYRKR